MQDILSLSEGEGHYYFLGNSKIDSELKLGGFQKAPVQDSNHSNIIGQSAALGLWGGLGGYPICSGKYKDICIKCKAEARNKPKSGWLRDGKENYMACAQRELAKIESVGGTDTISDNPVSNDTTGSVGGDSGFPPSESGQMTYQGKVQAGGMSSGMKVALIVGGVGVLGLVVYLVAKGK